MSSSSVPTVGKDVFAENSLRHLKKPATAKVWPTKKDLTKTIHQISHANVYVEADLTWRTLFFWAGSAVSLGLLPGMKLNVYFGRQLFLLLHLSVLGSSWDDEDAEDSASLSSRYLEYARHDLFPWRRRLVDLTTSGTGFCVTNRLSPESLQTQWHIFYFLKWRMAEHELWPGGPPLPRFFSS